MKAVSKWEKRRKRLFHIIEVGSDFDEHSRWYDYENAAAILINLAVTIMLTFEKLRASYGGVLEVILHITLFFSTRIPPNFLSRGNGRFSNDSNCAYFPIISN